MIATIIILLRPVLQYSFIFLIFPIARHPINPPKGKAIKGSITILAIGLKASKNIANKGPIIEAKNDGYSLRSSSCMSSSAIFAPFFERIFAITTVTIIPKTAGIRPANIIDVKGILNASEAAIALGLGDIIFPAFPPPIIAMRMEVFEILIFFASASAIGATVMTAISINTPTAVSIHAEITKANSAFDSPRVLTIVSAILLAAPVSIRTPANIPAVTILKIAGIIP